MQRSGFKRRAVWNAMIASGEVAARHTLVVVRRLVQLRHDVAVDGFPVVIRLQAPNFPLVAQEPLGRARGHVSHDPGFKPSRNESSANRPNHWPSQPSICPERPKKGKL